MAETESQGSHEVTEDKQVTCPVCQQLFSETYIAIHAANCELHVDNDSNNTGRSLLSASSSKLRQTTLTHKPLNTHAQYKKAVESDSDPELVRNNL